MRGPNFARMRLRATICALALLLLTTLSARADVPVPDGRDHYPPNRWTAWEVCRSPSGVDVRTSPQLRTLLRTPRARWGAVDPASWPCTWTLPRGYVATARVVDGSTIITDSKGAPWLVLDLGDQRVGVAPALGRVFWAADSEPTKPDANGNFRRTTHTFWQVIDPDPNGLNVRLHPRFPSRYEDDREPWPESPVRSWPVIGTVARGDIVQARRGNVGVIHVTDPSGARWLMIAYGQGVGFVRWSTPFVRPVAGPVWPFKARR